MKSIVIGSGFGGIAAALRLKAKNHDVTLIEKHPDLGGRARVFKKNGFTFDAGPTVITAPYLIEELFELFNKKALIKKITNPPNINRVRAVEYRSGLLGSRSICFPKGFF